MRRRYEALPSLSCGDRNALALAVLCESAFFPLLRANSTDEHANLTWTRQRRDCAFGRIHRLLHAHLVVVVHNVFCVALVLFALLLGASALLCALLLVHLHFVALLRLCVRRFRSEQLLLKPLLVTPFLLSHFSLLTDLLLLTLLSEKFFLPSLLFWFVCLVSIASPLLLSVVFCSAIQFRLFRGFLSGTFQLVGRSFFALSDNSIEHVESFLLFALA